jgi:long-subunit acyl-CoA synthetase (AMP-forming)
MAGYVEPVPDVVDADGWVHTGDLGEIGDDGYVRVLGRRQEVLRLADGYPVPLTRVESQLRANPFVEHACVVGEGDGLCALLVVSDPGREAELVRVMREANRYLPERERIGRFAVLVDRWEPGRADELAHTGKLKRPLIAGKYAGLIGALLRSGTGIAVP